MLPDRCSVVERKRQCVNPPEFVVSVMAGRDEYMVGVTCERHKLVVSGKIRTLQGKGRIHDGKISFSPLKIVGTDCIRADDLVQIDVK